ncbi:MAG: hypothetical protein ACK5MT_15435 [Actinomycetales bacterium]
MSAVDDREYRKAFYQAVDIQQGADPRQRGYYVPIYQRDGMRDYDLVPQLRDSIEFSVAESVQFLSGCRGSGKTSELMRLREELESAGYRVAYSDIEDYFNTLQPMPAPKLPYALAAGFARALDRDPDSGPMRRFFEFLKRVDVDVDATLRLPQGPSITALVRDDTSFAAEAAKVFRENRRTFRQEFHAFFTDVLASLDSDQPVVYLVDSIDHWRGTGETFEAVRASVEQAFTELADDLRIPQVHVIYTVPIYLDLPGLGLRRDVVNVKIAARDGTPFEPGIDALHEVLRVRAPRHELDRLFSPDHARATIQASGGMFRDLLRLTRQTLLETRALPAHQASLDRAQMLLREGYATTFTREQIEILRSVDSTHELFTERDRKSDEAALVTLGAILRYPNATTTWYAVHPLLRPLL